MSNWNEPSSPFLPVKICTVVVVPDPPPPTPCQIQKRNQLLKAGKTICPKPPVEQPSPPPPCLALCFEKIKNPPVDIPCHEFRKVCVVEREITTQDRCDAILALTAGNPDVPRSFKCPDPPPPPPPPEPTPCDIQRAKVKALEKKAKCTRECPIKP